MLTATAIATIGSRMFQPVIATSAMAIRICSGGPHVGGQVPAVGPSVTDRCRRPARIRASATAPLIMFAITETSRPMPTADSMSLGLSRRSTALMMMTTAAIAMQVPSMIAEKHYFQ